MVVRDKCFEKATGECLFMDEGGVCVFRRVIWQRNRLRRSYTNCVGSLIYGR